MSTDDGFIYPAEDHGPLLEDNIGENRYRAEVDDGQVRITDELNHNAWVTSDIAFTHNEIRRLRGGQ